MNAQYDVVIIGGGIAGVSAALTCRSRGKSVAVIANGEETSSLYKAERITNYPGIAAASGKISKRRRLAMDYSAAWGYNIS